MEIDSDVIKILISAGIPIIVAGLYWLGRRIWQWWEKRMIFLRHKGYALELLERYEKTLKTGDIIFFDDSYKKEDLSFMFINGKDNDFETIENINMPTVILAVLKEEKYLSTSDIDLLCTILIDMCQKDKWLNKFCGTNHKGRKIDCADLILKDKNNINLTKLPMTHYIYSFASSDKISKILIELKYKGFDEKIIKIIDRELEKRQHNK